jgi:hypothetical protein
MIIDIKEAGNPASQSVDKVLSPLCGGRAFLAAKNKKGNQKTRFGISP